MIPYDIPLVEACKQHKMYSFAPNLQHHHVHLAKNTTLISDSMCDRLQKDDHGTVTVPWNEEILERQDGLSIIVFHKKRGIAYCDTSSEGQGG